MRKNARLLGLLILVFALGHLSGLWRGKAIPETEVAAASHETVEVPMGKHSKASPVSSAGGSDGRNALHEGQFAAYNRSAIAKDLIGDV